MGAILTLLLPALRSYWSYGALAIMSLLAWHFDARAVANADAVRIQAAQFKQTQAAASAAAQAALIKEQSTYQTKAKEADNAHQTELADAQSAADRYIAAHGVCPATAGSDAGHAAAAAQDSGAGIPQSLPAGSVVVSADDVHACTAAVTYGLNARNYVLSISSASGPSKEPTDGN